MCWCILSMKQIECKTDDLEALATLFSNVTAIGHVKLN